MHGATQNRLIATLDEQSEIVFVSIYSHSWAQRKLSPLSPLSPLNILLTINGPLLS